MTVAEIQTNSEIYCLLTEKGLDAMEIVATMINHSKDCTEMTNINEIVDYLFSKSQQES